MEQLGQSNLRIPADTWHWARMHGHLAVIPLNHPPAVPSRGVQAAEAFPRESCRSSCTKLVQSGRSRLPKLGVPATTLRRYDGSMLQHACTTRRCSFGQSVRQELEGCPRHRRLAAAERLLGCLAALPGNDEHRRCVFERKG